jgi:hypothetical protein
MSIATKALGVPEATEVSQGQSSAPIQSPQGLFKLHLKLPAEVEDMIWEEVLDGFDFICANREVADTLEAIAPHIRNSGYNLMHLFRVSKTFSAELLARLINSRDGFTVAVVNRAYSHAEDKEWLDEFSGLMPRYIFQHVARVMCLTGPTALEPIWLPGTCDLKAVGASQKFRCFRNLARFECAKAWGDSRLTGFLATLRDLTHEHAGETCSNCPTYPAMVKKALDGKRLFDSIPRAEVERYVPVALAKEELGSGYIDG